MEILKWGVTLLVSLETAMFFIREQMAKDLGLTSILKLPFERWIGGTLFLFVIATCCFLMSLLVSTSYRAYAAALKTLPDLAGPIVPISRWGRYLVLMLYFVFPIVDGVIYFVVLKW